MKEIKLGDIFDVYDGTHSTPNYVEKGIPFFSVESIQKKYYEIDKFVTSEVYEKESKRVIPQNGDIFMSRIGDIGTARVLEFDEPSSFYVTLALIKKNKEIYPKYAKACIESNFYQKELWRRTLHVAFPKKINLSEISATKFLITDYETQVRIGELISSIDELIRISEKLNENYLLLKTYYSNEFFKIGRNEQNFKTNDEYYTNLEKITSICTGNKDLKDSVADGLYNFYVRSKTIEKINEYSYDGEAILLGGDGKIDDLLHYYNGKLNHHQRVYLITSDVIDMKYLYYSLQSGIGRHVMRTSAKTTVDSIRLPFLKNYPVLRRGEEQETKIARILSNIDDLMSINLTKIEYLNKLKTYYLKEIFD